MKISIVIPNYNGSELLEKNIPALVKILKKEKNTFEIIIVDDASTDKSNEVISDLVSSTDIGIKALQNEKNLGFSSTIDKGIRSASANLVLLLNSDVLPEKGFLQPLLKYFSDTKTFAVGAMDKSVEKERIVLRGRGVGRWERGFLLHSRGEVDKNNTLWVSGGSSLIQKNIYENLGGFDNLFNPFYWEDIDLSYRALKMGYNIYFEKASMMIHSHEKGAIKSHYSEQKVKQIAYRNQFIFVWKDITDIRLLLSHFFWLPVFLLKAIFRWDKEFLIGFLLAATKLPVIIRKRKKYVISDTDILRGLQK